MGYLQVEDCRVSWQLLGCFLHPKLCFAVAFFLTNEQLGNLQHQVFLRCIELHRALSSQKQKCTHTLISVWIFFFEKSEKQSFKNHDGICFKSPIHCQLEASLFFLLLVLLSHFWGPIVRLVFSRLLTMKDGQQLTVTPGESNWITEAARCWVFNSFILASCAVCLHTA